MKGLLVDVLILGAAFVRLSSKTEAMKAISGLHQSQTMLVSLVKLP